MTTVQRLLASVCCILLVSSGHAESMASLPADIAPQPLAQALTTFAKQTGLQLVYVSEVASALKSNGTRAALSVADALTQLLEGTGLTFEFLNDRTVTIYTAPDASSSPLPTPVPKSSREHSEWQPAELGKVLVTARRREEQVSHVPMSIAVWTQEEMAASGIKSMTEIGALTPGVEFDHFPDSGAGVYTNVSIRGVNDRNGTTVGVFLDDSPMPAPGSWGGNFGRAYPVTFDLERVEVLRGPQGTLLGEGTEGGAVRFIVNQPSLISSTSLLRTEYSVTARGAPSFEMGAAAGGPVVPEALGYRISAWYRSEGGYVNRVDPFTGATVDKDANRSVTKSVRGALTIAPTDWMRITPSMTYQSVSINDSSSFFTYLSDPTAGELNNGKLLSQPVTDEFYLPSLKITVALGAADLSSVTSYFHRAAATGIDSSNNAAAYNYPNPLGPEYPIDYSTAHRDPLNIRQAVFTEEVRLTSSDVDAPLTWLAGAFYSHSRNRQYGDTVGSGIEEWGPLTGFAAFDADQSQIAGYGQIDFRIGKQLTVDLGLRFARDNYESAFTDHEPVPGTTSTQASDSTSTPRLGLTYRPDEQNLLYLTIAKGYRMGGINGLPAEWAGIDCRLLPSTYRPDNVWNYEIGAKSTLLDGHVQLSGSVFHVSWQDPQLFLVFDPANTACGYVANAGHATSDGFDLGVQALLGDQTRAGLSVSYTDARYTQTVSVDIPAPFLFSRMIVRSGDALGALPIVPSPWNLTAFLEHDFVLGHGTALKARAEDIFHSRNPGPFVSEDPGALFYAPGRRPDPSTNLLNLRADLQLPSVDLSLFVENALDSQPTLLRRNRCCQETLFYATTFRPRTIGASATWRF
jgi:iron complex outermembrane recepter protein